MYNSLLEIPFQTALQFPHRISHKYTDKSGTHSLTFAEFARYIRILTAGFEHFGIRKKDHVGFFMNNRYEWMATDMALMALGAVSVPRGSDTTPREVQFIYNHSDSEFIILENQKQLKDLLPIFTKEDWEKCKRIFILDCKDDQAFPDELTGKTCYYKDVLKAGESELEKEPLQIERLMKEINKDDLVTIVYTSGTTGNPKGVMLTHGNFIQNVVANTPRLEIDSSKEEKTVVMLPSWHVYERAFEYCGLSTALTLVYSSAGRFASDLIKEKPEILISVPRIWESIYQKMIRTISQMPAFKRYLIFSFIKINQMYLSSGNYMKGCYISLKKRSSFHKGAAMVFHFCRWISMTPGHLLAQVLFKPFREKVGGNLRGATSAAGSLPKYLDELFNSIGINIANAYGMTECAPGILSRTFGRNTFGTTGVPFDNTEVQIRRADGSETDIGEKGIIFARGPQVMLGYYKNPEATKAVLDDQGWMNTGDLAVRSENGEVIIVGRAKDTIVLMGGENVEPEPIEDKMKESLFIDHAVVFGQDQKQLSAIVAVNEEELMKLAQELKLQDFEVQMSGKDSIEQDHIYEVIMKEVNQLISREQGFKPFEFVTKILPVRNDFSIGKELTQTLKVKRQFIEEKYKSLLNRLNEDTDKIRKKVKKKKK
ncbi:long-chain fatty acid--CoA ligase [Oceanispirochaeta crateris]|uniref:Long-chain fatty acid--CoA ligase n=1 Tax=Oceanispirochaeta crateris TaxID=2518645 RepID=A0A5C1QG56_9SPIO|nr:long-chain fatty acid--CoA ligase [Oceanispirochaeta crateris]QEN06491.1 long-chain fatty acid--CoA ligase [Oceanispirochaeta crateris]